MNDAIKMSNKLGQMIENQQTLQTKLTGSLLVQRVWADAFQDGMSCKFSGKMRMLPSMSRDFGFTQAWLKRADGRMYYLSKNELEQLKVDALIHPDYKGANDENNN
jgi:hypothetical protein